MPHRSFRRWAGCAALTTVMLAAGEARAADDLAIGEGHKPGVAVDAAGTAYIAWYGPESNITTLRFCRLARGASDCEGADTITAPGTSLSRPFVAVTGDRVVVAHHRYGLSGPGFPNFAEVWEFISDDRGATFDGGRPVGLIPFDEAVRGPGDTLTAATNAFQEGLVAQSMPLDGGGGAPARAVLSTDHPYNGAVGLVDAATPLAVFADGAGNAQLRRYGGAGSLNDPASWLPPVEIGYADYPRLAGGPSGLFLLHGRLEDRALQVRKYDGATFDGGVSIAGAAEDAQAHLAQDAGGRLHAAFPELTAEGQHLVHAISDDGETWRAGTILNQAEGGLASLRAAAAPDHVGVIVFETAASAGPEVRVATLGPNAPSADLPAKVKPPVKARRLAGGKVRLAVKGRLGLPESVGRAAGCQGSVTIAVKRGKRAVATTRIKLTPECRFVRALVLSRAKAKRARRLAVTVRFRGNDTFAPAKRAYTVTIK